jgi:arylsulfatase A-like enzyme/HEAT repeat protein
MQQRGVQETRVSRGRSVAIFAITTFLLILCDAPGTFRAWASPLERFALLVACSAVLGSAYHFALAWTAFWRRRWPRFAPALAAAPHLFALSILLGSTHVGRSRFGTLAPAVAAVGLTVTLLTFRWILRELPRSTGTALLFLLCGCAIGAQLALPLRHLLPLRALLLVIAFAALNLAEGRVAPALPREGRTLLTAIILGLLATFSLRISGNVRFIALGQAPATGLVLSFMDNCDGWDGWRHFWGWSTLAGARSPERGRSRVESADSLPAIPNGSAALLGGAHLVLITIDALRADRMNPQMMPNLFRFAERGWRFDRTYAQAPHTAFSLSTLLTAERPDALSSCPETLATRLRKRRWWTEAFYPAGLFFDGRSQLSCYAEDHFGFEWADTQTRPADQLTDAVITRLDTVAAHREPRTFVWVHYFDPHEPYEARLGVLENAPPRARYDSEVRFTDAELGRLLRRLARLERPVLVVVTGDHGEEFGEHGGAYHGSSVYDEQVRVPLVFGVIDSRMPNPGRVIEEPVELTDVMPTVASLLDLPAAKWPGRDLSLNLESPAAHAQVDSLRMRVEGRYKLIHDLRRDFNQLYDLETDPEEQHNVFDQRPEVAAPMRLALDATFGLVSPTDLLRRLEESPDAAERLGAARELGLIEAPEAKEALFRALADENEGVRAEAALALSALGDPRVTEALRALLDAEGTRTRAALALGRLRDSRAVPLLVEVLGHADPAIRRHAAHYLGFLGGIPAIEPLERAAADLRVRGEAYLALGRIAGRVHEPLLVRWLGERLGAEQQEDARAHLAWGLAFSQAREPRLLSRLAMAAMSDPPVRFAGEALERLDAVSLGVVGGTGFAPGLEAKGLGRCRRKSGDSPAEFLDATTCVQTGPELRVRVKSPERIGALLFRGRALGEERRKVSIMLDGTALDPFEVGERFQEVVIRLPAPSVNRGGREVAVTVIGATAREEGLLELDQLLLIP